MKATYKVRARFGADRLNRAVQAYWSLRDPFIEAERKALVSRSALQGRPRETRRPALAELAVDVAIGVEALISAIRYERSLRAKRDEPLTVMELALGEPEVDEHTRQSRDRFLSATKYVREMRNGYLHGGNMPPDNGKTITALRDALEVGLRFAAAFPSLRRAWREAVWQDIDESLWRFVGQPAFYAEQVRRIFSARQFHRIGGRLHLSRHGGTGQFRLAGPFAIAGRLEQSRWGFTGSGAELLKFPDIHAAIGIVSPPARAEETDNGEETVEGSLELVARDLSVQFDGLDTLSNPLLEPVYLHDGQNSPWTYGPGDVRLVSLKLQIPYRARTRWYTTPEPSLHILSDFLECDAIGSVDGELWFASPGHDGDSAFKGKARIGGVASAASHGQQLAERKLLGSAYGPSRGSGIWGGASKLQFWSDLLLDIEFSRF